MSNKRVVLGIAIIEGIVILGSMTSVVLGYVYVGTKAPAQKAVAAWEVCGQDIVKRYNDSFSASDSKALESNLKALSDEISKKSEYTRDATCNYIVLSYYLRTDDLARVEESYSNLVKSVDAASTIAPSLIDLKSMGQIKTAVDLYNYDHRSGAGNKDEPNG